MSQFLDILLGRPLATDEDSGQKIGPAAGIPIFGLDALGSAAYGPEAALTVLLPLGVVGIAYTVPITVSILILLGIVYLSYRQTIDAYPQGAGSYTVARENLGERAGLLAGAALIIDYLLNVAVGIATGVGALVSAAPSLQPHTLALCLGVLVILTLLNLRGMREAGAIFMGPTYVFIACMLGAVGIGLVKMIAAGGHPVAVAPPAQAHAAVEGLSLWLLLRAFSSGCTAMTGVEAVSNGVQSFRQPVTQLAKRTLTIIIVILAALLGGMAILVRAYGIPATDPGQPGYQSLLSQLIAAVVGRGAFYYVSMGSILVVLSLSANTSFAAFPSLCRTMAQNRFLPYGFTLRGRRLVYSYGVYSLALLSAGLLIVFGGVTDRLIPLFAIGAFLSFTLSQAGMVSHWKKQGGKSGRVGILINGTGAAATGITVVVVAVAKFTEGAWITVALLPAFIILMLAIRRHYRSVKREVASHTPLEFTGLKKPLVVVPVDDWDRITKKALRFAMSISDDVHAVHIDAGDDPGACALHWEEGVVRPARAAGVPVPELTVLKSPYRYVVAPILNHVLELERNNPHRQIAVVISELVEKSWHQYLLHNQRAELLTAQLTIGGDKRIAVINVPWYFEG